MPAGRSGDRRERGGVQGKLRGLDVREVENQQWESGISSSVRVGVEALVTANPRIAAVVLML